MMQTFVDTTKWKFKKRALEQILATKIPILVNECSQEIMRATIQNLSGPQIKPGVTGAREIGKMPVPRRTGMLVHSVKNVSVGYGARMIYADEKVANYAKYVHNGTRKMRPRRFLGDVVRERRQAFENRWRYTLINAINKAGQ